LDFFGSFQKKLRIELIESEKSFLGRNSV